MNAKNIVAGLVLIAVGLALVAYYDLALKPEHEAGKLFREAKLIKERAENEEPFNQDVLTSKTLPEGQSPTYSRLENRASINRAIDLFTKIIAHYPDTKYARNSVFMIADSYEKIGLYRIAYLKYSYLMKDKMILVDKEAKQEVLTRLARLKVKKNYSEEGISQLYALLGDSTDLEFRSRIYSEIGYSYLKTNQVTKADQAFDLALRENAENQEALLGKARSLKRLGKSGEAFTKYDYFLAHHGAFSEYTPDVKRAYKNQAYTTAMALYKKGSYWSAIKYFNLVLKKFPGSKYVENSYYWLGESYYSLGKYSSARKYYRLTMNNGYYHKDQDARIKNGYSYFMEKKYDLAAREFQLYLDNYPNGKYVNIAKKWKQSSAKELTWKLEQKQESETMLQEFDEQINYDTESKDPDTVSSYSVSNQKIELDDVTEL